MQYKTLDSLCKVASGGTPSRSKKEYWDGGDIPWIKIGNIKSKVVSNADEYITEAGLNNSSAKLFKKGTILYTIFATLGEVGILDFDACTNQAIAGISIEKTEEITTDYLYYYLKSKKAEVNQIGRGVAQNNINLSILRKFSIPMRDIDEQKTIVDSLNKAESIIEKQKRQLEQLDELIKARFVEMFNRNFNNTVELGNVCDVRDGTHDSPKYHDEGYPLVTSKNICDGEIDFSTCNLIQKEDYDKINKRSKVDIGDILMPMIGTVGNPIIVNTDKEFAIKNVALIKFKDDTVALNSFIKALLESDYFDRAVLSKTKGGTQKFISLGDIRKLEFNLPPIELQKQFATFVTQVDKSKFALSNELAMCNFYVRLVHDCVMHGCINL
ncbi:restriction endonuclease subunit S [Candidatus Saccharibacteria bacterium]|nr:restriction endonuclease subunit S [Candidatus Saccharibacteria bacterium]